MKRNWSIAASAVALVVLAACSEDRTTGPAGQDAFARYVSLGTSVSMGVQSDGVYYASQQHAWPALLLTRLSLPNSRSRCFRDLVATHHSSRRCNSREGLVARSIPPSTPTTRSVLCSVAPLFRRTM